MWWRAKRVVAQDTRLRSALDRAYSYGHDLLLQRKAAWCPRGGLRPPVNPPIFAIPYQTSYARAAPASSDSRTRGRRRPATRSPPGAHKRHRRRLRRPLVRPSAPPDLPAPVESRRHRPGAATGHRLRSRIPRRPSGQDARRAGRGDRPGVHGRQSRAVSRSAARR